MVLQALQLTLDGNILISQSSQRQFIALSKARKYVWFAVVWLEFCTVLSVAWDRQSVSRDLSSVCPTHLSLFGLYKDIFFFLLTATPQPQSHLTSVSLDESDIFLGVDGRKGRGRKKKRQRQEEGIYQHKSGF